jgi:hypothetical protein
MNSKLKRKADQITKRFPDVWLKDCEDFNGSKGALWSGEGADIDGAYAFDYYGYRDTMGVHPDLFAYLSKIGMHSEWYDSGTVLIYVD